ncbi:hypothetical protein [Tumebacillus permanentifrigoris]|uniref:Yip1-like protein n=1 Tax=Tumebacillus permanentifrigoris TaxID=378543 RepID=A0A316D7W6_9BACL|nr:hypothetical protein [Tumebacillus permanentifrigoris]PWK11227.1 hypothetical protein C7459_11120 [Tumebacillus permanentifrigoris]
MTDLITILFKPKRTLEKLLMERDMKRSWRATWTIIVLYAVLNLIYFLVGREQLISPFTRMSRGFGLDTASNGVSLALALGVWAVVTLYLLVDTILSRFGWEWFARMGIRMVGGQQYAALSPEEKRERGRLMQLIHPYTLSGVVIASFIGGMISLLSMQTSMAAGESGVGAILLQLIGSGIAFLLSIGSVVLMIVQRVFAVQQVYGVSGARAFWGPFIPYAVLIFLLLALTVALVVFAFVAALQYA